MKEIIVYGRGGQGVVIASKLLATAAFKEGRKYSPFLSLGWSAEARLSRPIPA